MGHSCALANERVSASQDRLVTGIAETRPGLTQAQRRARGKPSLAPAVRVITGGALTQVSHL